MEEKDRTLHPRLALERGFYGPSAPIVPTELVGTGEEEKVRTNWRSRIWLPRLHPVPFRRAFPQWLRGRKKYVVRSMQRLAERERPFWPPLPRLSQKSLLVGGRSRGTKSRLPVVVCHCGEEGGGAEAVILTERK